MKRCISVGKNACKGSRRGFLKTAAISAVGASALGATSLSSSTEAEDKSPDTFSLFRKEHEKIEDIYEISTDYKRMDQINTGFSRGAWDETMETTFFSIVAKKMGMVSNPLESERGWSQMDHALAAAAWGGHDAGTGMSAVGQANGGVLNNWETHTTKLHRKKYPFASREEASKYIKRAATFLGAHDVGIAPYDERWVYSKWYDPTPKFETGGAPIHVDAKFPFDVKSVIVTIHEMDYDAMKCSGEINDAGVGLEYSHMAEVTHKISVFLNKLGYKAIPTGNDVGLSIPAAIQAGLGEISRMGTLIHEKFGSRFRIAKVYTDLELAPDKPITFGVQEFCRKCKKCADACPSNSISLETEPTREPSVDSISSHPGVKKWYQNNETCLKQWEKHGCGCGICISVCPYNKHDTWVHDIAKLAVGVPVGRDIARQLDDAFGYGTLDDKHVAAFWNKKI